MNSDNQIQSTKDEESQFVKRKKTVEDLSEELELLQSNQRRIIEEIRGSQKRCLFL
ncbi:MAG TPA: hypothetical protein VJJ01_01880 [Nitrosopumilaceae archaeon]|nr:hypothetical protein [Nitrosopumilaceae archaeon]